MIDGTEKLKIPSIVAQRDTMNFAVITLFMLPGAAAVFFPWCGITGNTVKPLLSEPPIKRHPLLSVHLAGSRNEPHIFPFKTNSYSADTSLKRTRTLKQLVFR